MNVMLNGISYRISFYHGVGLFDFDYRDSATGEKTVVKETREFCECYITTGVGDQKVMVYKGIAVCHPNDLYDKEKGRKIALTAALTHVEDRATRGRFWNAYLGRKKKSVEQTIPAGI